MIKKILNNIKKDIKVNYKFYLITLFLIVLFNIKLDYYIYSPGSLVDLTNRISVNDGYKAKGSFNLTYVTARNGTIPNILLSYIIPNWDLSSLDDMRYDDESEKEIVKRDQIYLKETSYDAIIAAFKEAGKEVEISNINVTVSLIYDLADTDLKIGDVIKKVNDVEINSFDELKNEIAKYKENDRIKITVLRDKKTKECYSVLKKEKDRVIIGVSLAELKDVKTDPKVEYVFKDNESGSSRGLMCALDIYNKITESDLTKGKKISGTGSIDEDGIVGAIDGVKYKLTGAVKKKADVFIVPTKNYDEAIKLKEKNKYNIIIISADNLHSVIEELNKLK